ncbi:unnamed protein product, partial [Candidula unifasciata]
EYCNQPYDIGPCKSLVPRIYYNAETSQCENFTWGGCGGNANNFPTLDECLDYCVRVE